METLATTTTLFNAVVPFPTHLAVFGIGVPELLLIFGVLILLFGATKLPSLAKGLGQSIKEFKKATQDDDNGGANKPEQKPTSPAKDNSDPAA